MVNKYDPVARRAGANRWKDGGEEIDNPYPKGSIEYHNWMWGFRKWSSGHEDYKPRLKAIAQRNAQQRASGDGKTVK